MFLALTPEQFEGLIFDLVSAKGLVNVRWRTPGADGGRDIQADELDNDFSGEAVKKSWFVECKRYKNSVDWPTVYGKLAYADSHHADYLLMCTPSKFSPNAISHAEEWNKRRGDLKIRLWPGHEIERHLLQYPDIAAKYGLLKVPNTPGKSLVTLSLALSKAVSTYHSSIVFADAAVEPMLEAAQSFANLLTQRMADLETESKIVPILRTPQANAKWQINGSIFRMDIYAIEAFLAYLYALTRRTYTLYGQNDYSVTIKITDHDVKILNNYISVFSSICLWGDIELEISANELTLSQRTGMI